MPGSATLGSNLVDELLELADDLREDLSVGFGTRPYRVWTVQRVYPSGTIGDGDYTDTETEITPRPRVLPWLSSVQRTLEPCGIDETGTVELREVSLTYTYDELTGGDLAAGTDWFIKLTEGESQEQPARYFTINKPPFPDREKDIGWRIELLRASSVS